MSRSAHAAEFPSGGLTRGYQAAAGGFDEFVDGSGAPRPHWDTAAAGARRAGPGHTVPAHGAAQFPRAGDGHCLRSLLRSGQRDAAMARRSRSADHRRRGVAGPGARTAPARAAVRSHPRRPLRAAASADVGRHSPSARVQRSVLSAALPWPEAAGRVHPVLRHRHRARTRWALARDRHAYRNAGRHRLRARQPHGAHQRRRRHLLGVQGDAAGAVLSAVADVSRPAGQSRRPDHRAADAGPAPQRLLQPRLPRALSRAAAGGRRRPARDAATACRSRRCTA